MGNINCWPQTNRAAIPLLRLAWNWGFGRDNTSTRTRCRGCVGGMRKETCYSLERNVPNKSGNAPTVNDNAPPQPRNGPIDWRKNCGRWESIRIRNEGDPLVR